MSRESLVFVGTYTEPIRFGTGQILEGKGKGIYVYRFDADTGSLEPFSLTEGVRNPSFVAVHPSRRFLYAVNEMKEFEGQASGAISAFALEQATGRLTFLNQKPTHGTDPCHVIVDPTGRWVLVANYSSGSVCVLPIHTDGSLGDASHVVRHQGSSVDPVRQTGPHAHGVTFDASGRFGFVPDLGMDKVMLYEFDTLAGALKPCATPWVQTRPGAGPRQLVMHPQGRYAYLINELDSTITAFGTDAVGSLREIQTVSTLPHDFTGSSSGATVQVSPQGDYLYGSNRGADSIVIYAIDQTEGTLTCIGHESTRGRVPRNFTVDPSGEWLLVANQHSDNIVVFRVDRPSGGLVATGDGAAVPAPVCVVFL